MFYTSKIPILFDFIREKRIYRDVLGKKWEGGGFTHLLLIYSYNFSYFVKTNINSSLNFAIYKERVIFCFNSRKYYTNYSRDKFLVWVATRAVQWLVRHVD